MENNPAPLRRSPPGAGGPPTNPRALLAHALLLAGAAGAVFVAGGAPQGSLGIFLVCAGLALVGCPPRVAVEGRLWLAGGALIGCGAAAFLPWRSLPVPAWRAALAAVPAIPLPATVTPAPWETAFWLALVALSVVTGLFALSQPVRSPALLALALGAVLACAGYAALSMLAWGTGWRYPWTGEGATFGFFANRNNTATFLITGSVLAAGVLGVSFRDRRWVSVDLAVAALALCVPGLFFFSASRAGVLVLFLGIILWAAGLGARHRPPRVALTLGVVLLLGAAAFLAIPSEARHRLFEVAGGGVRRDPPPARAGSGQPATEVFRDSRLPIYRDALGMVRDYPLTGTGLGTFALVFPQYRRASVSEAPIIHPESDWLMTAAECGLPALLCLGALGWWTLARLRPLPAHPYWPLRWGCVAAALAAVIHGIFDAPAHHVALGWWMLALAGLGLQTRRDDAHPAAVPPSTRVRRAQHAAFVLAGVGALALGGRLVGAQWFGAPPLPPFYAAAMQPQIFDTLCRPGGAERAMDLAQATIRRAPMYDATYFLLTEALGQFEGVRDQMDGNCLAQRLLNPTAPGIPLEQGDLWVDLDPARAAAFWLDSLARTERVNRATGEPVSTGAYANLIYRAGNRPELQRRLWSGSSRGTAYVFAWLENAPAGLCRTQLETLAGDDGFLARLSPPERARFVSDWETRGDRQTLERFRAGHPGW